MCRVFKKMVNSQNFFHKKKCFFWFSVAKALFSLFSFEVIDKLRERIKKMLAHNFTLNLTPRTPLVAICSKVLLIS